MDNWTVATRSGQELRLQEVGQLTKMARESPVKRVAILRVNAGQFFFQRGKNEKDNDERRICGFVAERR